MTYTKNTAYAKPGRACAEPGCPTLIQHGPEGEWSYCEAHRTDEKEFEAAEDFLRGLLDNLKEELASIRRFLETTDDRHPGLQYLANRQTERLGWLEDAIYFGGNRWLVSLHAMFAGQGDTLIQSYLTEHDLRKRIDAMKPDADIGSRVRGGGKIKNLTSAQEDEVRTAMSTYAARREVAWSTAADEIAKQYSVSGRTIRRATEDLKYPPPKRTSLDKSPMSRK